MVLLLSFQIAPKSKRFDKFKEDVKNETPKKPFYSDVYVKNKTEEIKKQIVCYFYNLDAGDFILNIFIKI